LDLDLSRFPDVVRGIGDDLAIADGQDLNDMTLSVNAFLLRTDARLCLVDAGDGSRRGAHLGRLTQALKQTGYAAEDITDLFMTHLHGDHAAGLVQHGQPLFRNATLNVAEEEVAFWRNPTALDSIQATQLPFAEAALTVYQERLSMFRPGDALLPHVTVRSLPGHTPGQVGFLVGQTDQILISADVLHLPALQVAHPEWGFLFDADSKQALKTRLDLLTVGSVTMLRLAGAHIPFPGVIRLVHREGAIDYETAA